MTSPAPASSSSSASASASASSAAERVTQGKKCALCDQPGTKACGGCGQVFYCSKEHQKEHWKAHKGSCKQQHKAPKPVHDRDVPVTWEDQQRINTFSRLNTQYQRILDDLEEANNALANLKDAKSEVEDLLDDDACKIRVGEVFFDVSNEEAELFAEKQKELKQQQVRELTCQKNAIFDQMAELKKLLYGKFGNTINLESAEQTIAK